MKFTQSITSKANKLDAINPIASKSQQNKSLDINKINKTNSILNKSSEKVKKSSNLKSLTSPEHLPKNVNEYRHIIDTNHSRDSDVEWILELRKYKKMKQYETLKDSVGTHPELYIKGLDEYMPKVKRELKEKKENTLLLKGNSRDFEHLMIRRLGLQSNMTQLGFDSSLRKFQNEKIEYENSRWKTLAISPKKSLISLYLPPVTKHSIENLDKVNKFVSRPLEQIEEVIN